MGLDLSKTQAYTGLSGLIDLTTVDATPLSVNGLVLPTGGGVSSVYNIALPYSSSDVISLINVTVGGASAGISDYTFPLIGTLSLYDYPNSYSMYFVVQSASGGRNIQLQFANQTVGSSVTVPNLTINAHAHLYNYPF